VICFVIFLPPLIPLDELVRAKWIVSDKSARYFFDNLCSAMEDIHMHFVRVNLSSSYLIDNRYRFVSDFIA
jgi:hypothetical protein